MPRTIAVQDLQIGMFIKLEMDWISHPFPLSSFRISSADQIDTIRGLGLQHVVWLPEKSDLHESAVPRVAAVVAPAVAEAEHTRDLRREKLRVERESMRQCEARFEEAQGALSRINTLLLSDPMAASVRAKALARALLDKMLGEGELCIRLLSGHSGERLTQHALNVTVISMLMGRSLELPESELLDLGTGALLHDIGKLDLPTRVHHPQEDFTSAELKAYRDHVGLGLARARKMQLSAGALQVLAQHHELADGTGFPQRLTLDRLSTAARLVTLVNRYDNLCNPGPLALALTPHEAVSTLFAQSRNKFDMPVLNGFIRMMGVYPAGSVVQLTDDRFALVMQVNTSRPLKPRVLVHDAKVPRDEALLLDLEHEPDLGIRRSLPPDKLPTTAWAYLAPKPRVSYYFDTATVPSAEEEAGASP